MPFVNIDLRRGKSREYLEGVSNAVHDALVTELGMLPGDRFQLIHQREPEEMIFNRTFRGGPRSDDFIVITITDGADRGEPAKRRFYKTLIKNLGEGPRVKPADVFVMIQVTPPVNFSFADGTVATDVAAAEALDRAATVPGTRDAYTTVEMVDAITQLLANGDRDRILSMLRDDFVLTVPAALPNGGQYTGPKGFEAFTARLVSDVDTTVLRRVIQAEDHLIAQTTLVTADTATGGSVMADSVWMFDIAGGNFTRARIYVLNPADEGQTVK